MMFPSSILVILFALRVLAVNVPRIGPAPGFDIPVPRLVPEDPFSVEEGPSKPESTPDTSSLRPGKKPPHNLCTEPIVLFGYHSQICHSAASSTTSPLLANDKRIVTFLAKRASSTSSTAATTTCAASDSACNYCALAFSELDVCASIVYNAGLDFSYVPDCLCYEPTSDTDLSAIWAPNYFDKAFASCPVYASTADTSDLSLLQGATGLCWEYGDYYEVGTTDTGSYVLALATATTPAANTGTATVSSSAKTTTSAVSAATPLASASSIAPTATSQSGGSQGLHQYRGPFQLLFAITLFMELFLNMCTPKAFLHDNQSAHHGMEHKISDC